MIESLELRNWRSYEHLHLEFGPGVTFIVAPNGVGKSSIIEGARYAIYGLEPPKGGHRKANADGDTAAAVTLRLPSGSQLRVSRIVTKRKNVPAVTVELDGDEIVSDLLEDLLRKEFAGPIHLLDRLSMINGTDVVGTVAKLDLKAHLSEFLGVSGLDRALADTDELLKTAEAEVKRHRAASDVSRDELQRLQERAAQAAAHVADIEQKIAAAQQQLNEARAVTRDAERVAVLTLQAQERATKLRHLTVEVTDLFGPVDDPTELAARLADTETRVRDQLDMNRRRRVELDGRIAASVGQLADLDDATGTCPVCRRPLAPEDLAIARASHQTEIDAWTTERDVIVDDELEATAAEIDRFRLMLSQLGPAPDVPAVQQPDPEVARAAEAALVAAYEAVADDAVLARAEARHAEDEVAHAAAATAALEAVTSAFARQATLEATREALTQTRTGLLEQGIEPLAEDLDMHWSRLFRDRPGLIVAGDGDVTRTVGSEALTDSQFSDGERMVAQLLLRLLVLKATTQLPFMWIDEPLEHLDPDTRRALALLLATAPSGSSTGLRQVVMTTYEEPLVRRLNAAVPNVQLRYVRAGF